MFSIAGSNHQGIGKFTSPQNFLFPELRAYGQLSTHETLNIFLAQVFTTELQVHIDNGDKTREQSLKEIEEDIKKLGKHLKN